MSHDECAILVEVRNSALKIGDAVVEGLEQHLKSIVMIKKIADELKKVDPHNVILESLF